MKKKENGGKSNDIPEIKQKQEKGKKDRGRIKGYCRRKENRKKKTNKKNQM